jgi:beta-galactosidase
LQISALPYTDEIMTPVEYSVDLPPSVSSVLTIAARTLGVGSASCGPRPLDQYIVWSDPGAFSYILRLLPQGKVDLAETGRLGMPPGRVHPSVSTLNLPQAGPAGKIVGASSYEPGEGNPEHAVDGDPETFWHTRWSSDEAQPPHFLVVDYGHELNMAGVVYTARVDGDNGHVRDYEIYLGNDGKVWSSPTARGSFRRDADAETVHFPNPVKARYLKFVALSEQRGRPFASVAELEVIEADRDSHKVQNAVSTASTP